MSEKLQMRSSSSAANSSTKGFSMPTEDLIVPAATTEEAPSTEATETPVNTPEAAETPATEVPAQEQPVTIPTEAPTNIAETPVQEQPTEVPPQAQLDDSTVLNYLNETLGKEFSSFEDFTKVPEQAPPTEIREDVKQIMDWADRTGRPLSDWTKFQKDYDKMSDEGVAREILQMKYPGLDVNAELNDEYLPNEDDLDSDISKKKRNLQKLAIEGRKELNGLRLELDSPAEGYKKFTPEVQQELDFAKQVRDNLGNQEKQQLQYTNGISEAVNGLTSIPLNLAEGVSIDFNIDDTLKKGLPDMVNNMPHWYNQDGSLNHANVVQDVVKSQQSEKMIQLAYQQGLNAGLDNATKRNNNITLDSPSNMDASAAKPTGGIKVEGLETFFEGANMKAKFRKKR